MATPETDLDLFARVSDGEITEFPVYRLHIKNRAHPISWYTPVVELAKPTLPPFAYYKRTLVVKDTYVEASYEAVLYTLDEVLSQIHRSGAGLPGDDPVNIADVDPVTISYVYKLGGEYATAKLNAFAQSRGYDNIVNLCDFRDSTFAKFQAEGMRGFELRDATWKALVNYFGEVTTGVQPIPSSSSVIDDLMPALLWPDQDPVVEPTPETPVEETPTETTTVG